MVAKITFPKRVAAALNYNESKVANGKAVCLAAMNYLRDAEDMNFYQKLGGLQHHHALNERATTKTLHVSLNFDPSEKLSDERLIAIANLYMEKIGFGDQPYLIYRHQDAGHPHIHIVSTTINDDGRRINTHNIGRNASEKARKELEQIFGLIKAERSPKKSAVPLPPISVEKAIYGRDETKRALSRIISVIFNQYKFSSLPEYNAALRQFNVLADRGKEEGRIYRNGGLVYRMLDEAGGKVGIPIKASSIACRPTLRALEKKFKENEGHKLLAKQRLKRVLDTTLPAAQNMSQLQDQLSGQQVYVLVRKNGSGQIYGLTFVDNQTKCVFNGSDLGKEYSAALVQSRLVANEGKKVQQAEDQQKDHSGFATNVQAIHQAFGKKEEGTQHQEKLLNALLSTKEPFDTAPSYLLHKKRKKKKRRNPHSSS